MAFSSSHPNASFLLLLFVLKYWFGYYFELQILSLCVHFLKWKVKAFGVTEEKCVVHGEAWKLGRHEKDK